MDEDGGDCAKILLREVPRASGCSKARLPKIPQQFGKFPHSSSAISERRAVIRWPRRLNQALDVPTSEHPFWRRAAMASGHLPVSEWLQRIRAEYQEMPGLSLNKEQMQRMWGLDAFVCEALVDALVAAQVLKRTATGAYVVHGVGL
jgi:hypothetical protein